MTARCIDVDVCVVTYKKPQTLAALLRSVAAQRMAKNVRFTVCVIDNDAAGSARDVCASFAMSQEFPVHYRVETQRNVAVARNRAVECASGDYVAFVDEHGVVDPEWLQNLVDMAEVCGADAVFGRVNTVYPQSAPAWFSRGGFFQHDRFLNGVRVKAGSASNVLVRTPCLRRFAPTFDPVFRDSGVEDREFFSRLYRSGARFVWCDTAIVREHIPEERTSTRYLMKHAYFSGRAHASIALMNCNPFIKAGWLAARALSFATSMLSTCILWPFGRSLGAWPLQRACVNLGQLSVLARQSRLPVVR